MTIEAVITKMMFLLGMDCPKDKMKQLLMQSICGEIS